MATQCPESHPQRDWWPDCANTFREKICDCVFIDRRLFQKVNTAFSAVEKNRKKSVFSNGFFSNKKNVLHFFLKRGNVHLKIFLLRNQKNERKVAESTPLFWLMHKFTKIKAHHWGATNKSDMSPGQQKNDKKSPW